MQGAPTPSSCRLLSYHLLAATYAKPREAQGHHEVSLCKIITHLLMFLCSIYLIDYNFWLHNITNPPQTHSLAPCCNDQRTEQWSHCRTLDFNHKQSRVNYILVSQFDALHFFVEHSQESRQSSKYMQLDKRGRCTTKHSHAEGDRGRPCLTFSLFIKLSGNIREFRKANNISQGKESYRNNR